MLVAAQQSTIIRFSCPFFLSFALSYQEQKYFWQNIVLLFLKITNQKTLNWGKKCVPQWIGWRFWILFFVWSALYFWTKYLSSSFNLPIWPLPSYSILYSTNIPTPMRLTTAGLTLVPRIFHIWYDKTLVAFKSPINLGKCQEIIEVECFL